MTMMLEMQSFKRLYYHFHSQKEYAWAKSNRSHTQDICTPRVGEVYAAHLNGHYAVIQ